MPPKHKGIIMIIWNLGRRSAMLILFFCFSFFLFRLPFEKQTFIKYFLFAMKIIKCKQIKFGSKISDIKYNSTYYFSLMLMMPFIILVPYAFDSVDLLKFLFKFNMIQSDDLIYIFKGAISLRNKWRKMEKNKRSYMIYGLLTL